MLRLVKPLAVVSFLAFFGLSESGYSQSHPRDFGPRRYLTAVPSTAMVIAAPVIPMTQPTVVVANFRGATSVQPVALTSAAVVQPQVTFYGAATPVMPVAVSAVPMVRVPTTVTTRYGAPTMPTPTVMIPMGSTNFMTGNTAFGTPTLFANGQPVRNGVRFVVP